MVTEVFILIYPGKDDLMKPMSNGSWTRRKENEDEVGPANGAIDVNIATRSIGEGTLEWLQFIIRKNKRLALLCVKKRKEKIGILDYHLVWGEQNILFSSCWFARSCYHRLLPIFPMLHIYQKQIDLF